MTEERTHALDCDWHVDQYPWECTCGLIARKKAMDELIALSAYELSYTQYEIDDNQYLLPLGIRNVPQRVASCAHRDTPESITTT